MLSLPGDPARPVTLQVTLYMPDGPGPFPLAVMNHGSTHISASNRGERYEYTFSAYYFLSRGYAVALPMMRGFAGSGGSLVVDGCNVAAVGIANARDILAVIDDLARLPKIDASRVVVAGQSFGGWNTLALGTIASPAVKGLVSFAGGIRTSDCRQQDASLVAAAAYFGAHTKLPSLWFYGSNDQLFPPATWRAMLEHYTHAGGPAQLVAIGNFMNDSHQMLSYEESLPIWTPKLDAFLAGIGLPARVVDPRYLPTPLPAPARFAALTDIAAIPRIDDKGRALYRQFLQKPFPRVFVITQRGGAGVFDGGFDPLGRALRACAQDGTTCWPYAFDDHVVWTEPASAATEIQAVVAEGTMKTVGLTLDINPDCTSRGPVTIRIVQPPAHGTARVAAHAAHPQFPPDNPRAACNGRALPGTGVDYQPARDFTGADSLVFEETVSDRRQRMVRIAITVR